MCDQFFFMFAHVEELGDVLFLQTSLGDPWRGLCHFGLWEHWRGMCHAPGMRIDLWVCSRMDKTDKNGGCPNCPKFRTCSWGKWGQTIGFWGIMFFWGVQFPLAEAWWNWSTCHFFSSGISWWSWLHLHPWDLCQGWGTFEWGKQGSSIAGAQGHARTALEMPSNGLKSSSHQSLAIHPGNNNLLCGTWLECQEACPPLFGTRFTNVACCVSRRDWMGTADTGMGSSPALDQGSHQAIILVGGCRLSKLWSKVLQLSDLSVRWKVKRWISCPSWCSKIH